MKKISFLFLIVSSFIFSQNFGVNVSFIGQFPQGEFKDEGVPIGIGYDVNGMYYIVDELAFGLNIGSSTYGNSSRLIPFNYFTDLLTITEETTNNIAYGHLFFKILLNIICLSLIVFIIIIY